MLANDRLWLYDAGVVRSYLFKRLLLIPLTLLGVSCLVFALTRLVPGGPIEQMLQQQAISALEGESASQSSLQTQMNDEEREKLEEMFNLHEPTWKAYLQWLGVLPREHAITKASFGKDGKAYLSLQRSHDSPLHLVEIQRQGSTAYYLHEKTLREEGWHVELISPERLAQRAARRGASPSPESPQPWQVRVYQLSFDGLLQGSFGKSYKYNTAVWAMMMERMPATLYLGLLGALVSYGISLPLGVLKAIWHKSWFDHVSSGLIFIGYAIPGFALGAILLVYLGARLEWFPIYGLTSEHFETLPWYEQVLDVAWHTVLPLSCYVISTFAMSTMMMKNNLMENLSADYMRTAISKGASFSYTVYHHALRNSIIPIVSTLGSIIGMIFGGSVLIERVFDIQGFGMLSYQALLDKDYSLIMGTLMLSSLIIIVGNLIADVCVALIDPRIRFGARST